MKRVRVIVFMLAVLSLIFTSQAFSQEEKPQKGVSKKVDEEFQWLKEEAGANFVVTASRVLESIKKSASSITVITEEQIKQMGARHLMDALQTVPGIGVWYHPDGHYQVDIRGVTKIGGQDILLMLNSHPLNSSFSGGGTWVYDTMTVENIKRIEVIRGPGSAMYGANAFSGVINVFTKQAKDIDGVQLSATGGTYNTQQYNFLAGKTFNDFGFSFNFNYFNTDGYKPFLEKDGQNIWDNQMSQAMRRSVPNSSKAPGEAKSDDEKYDAALTLQYKGLKFDARYVDRERSTMSPLFALSDNSGNTSKDYYLNLSYETKLTKELELIGKVYRNHNEMVADYQMLAGGSTIVTPIATPPYMKPVVLNQDGLFCELSNKNDKTGIEIQTNYKIVESNTLVAGITYEEMKQYDVRYSANFLSPAQSVLIPIYSIQDLTDRQNYNNDAKREFKAVFLQDLWDITQNIRLTVGARYDDYSDFGSSFNPRAGLTWEFIKGYDVKLLYGRAFRAPNFQELYTKNNPLQKGNPNLKPEKIDTYEISFGADFNTSLRGRITGFRNTIKDNIIALKTSTETVFQNRQSLESTGIEAELKYDFGKGTYLAANYTYQESNDSDTKQTFYNIPKQKGNIMANLRFFNYFNWYSIYHFQADYHRLEGDPRDTISFGVINTSLIADNFVKGLELRGSVYNLLDTDYKFPYPQAALPDDFPMAGRSFLVELKYKY